MKSRLWKSFYALAVAASLVLLPAQKLKAEPFERHENPRIVGTWTVQVQLYNCQTEALIGSPFSSLLTFDVGETMTEATTNPGFAVGQRGPGHGIWRFTGHRSYSARDISFINYTTPPMPPTSPGFTAGTQTISQDIEFKNGPDEFTSDARIEFADASGAVYRKGCASAVGQRFK